MDRTIRICGFGKILNSHIKSMSREGKKHSFFSYKFRVTSDEECEKGNHSSLVIEVEKGFQDLFSPLISSGEMSTNFFGGCHLSSLRGNAVLRKNKGMSRAKTALIQNFVYSRI